MNPADPVQRQLEAYNARLGNRSHAINLDIEPARPRGHVDEDPRRRVDGKVDPVDLVYDSELLD